MSVRIESLGTRNRAPEAAWLALVAMLLAVIATVVLVNAITSPKNEPIRPPAAATSVAQAPTGAAIKAVANDPYLRSELSGGTAGQPQPRASVDSVFGPAQNMGRICPKCW